MRRPALTLVAVLAGESIVIFYRPGKLSALDQAQMERPRDVGATGVCSRRLGDRVLTFEVAGDGPRRGERLRAIPHVDVFWFA